MVNYKLGKIYRLECNITGLVYVGSTCEPTLAKRLTKHVAAYSYYLKGNRNYVSSFKILENKDYEKYPCCGSARTELKMWCTIVVNRGLRALLSFVNL